MFYTLLLVLSETESVSLLAVLCHYDESQLSGENPLYILPPRHTKLPPSTRSLPARLAMKMEIAQGPILGLLACFLGYYVHLLPEEHWC